MTDRDAQVFAQILEDRFSCRGFLPDEVPDETVKRLFGMAQRAASWCNSQAWHVHLTSGADTAAFAKVLTERVKMGVEAPDIPGPAAYEGAYLERRRASGFGLYNAVGVAREDREGRARQMLENFHFFGAPHVAVISTPRSLGVYGAVDCGGYVSTLLLAAQSLGLASIAQAAIAMYSDVVREHLGIPTERDIVCAFSFGYPDRDHPANGFRTARASIQEAVTGLP